MKIYSTLSKVAIKSYSHVVAKIMKIVSSLAKSPSKIAFIIASSIGFFGLITPWNSYHIEKWPTVSGASAEEIFLEGSSLQVSAKAYTAEESKKFLQKDVTSRGFQPIQITIQNNSPNAFSVSPGSVDLATVSSSKVATKVMYSAIPRAIAFKAASFLFWPFLIPDTINTIKTLRSHTLLKRDLESKTMKKEVVAPYSIFNRIVFVPMDEFKESFDVTLIDLETLEPKVLHIQGLKAGDSVKEITEAPAQDSSFEESTMERRAAQ